MVGADGPLVSVVIPTYNRPEYVRRAVESVAEQTYAPIELLVVDDCSETPVETTLERELFRPFERYEILRHDKNRGGSAARNTGIQAATGEYLALLDDDDRWKPEKVEKQVERLRADDVGAVYSPGRVVDERGETLWVGNVPESILSSETMTKRLLCRNVVGSCSAVMVDAEVVEKAGTFDERFPSWQDQEWFVRLSQHCEFGVIQEPLYVYADEAPNKVSDDVDATYETYPLFVDKYRSLAAEFGWLFQRKMRAWAAYRLGKTLVLSDDVREGREVLIRAVTLYPFEPVFYKFLLPALGGRPGYSMARRVRQARDRLL